MIPVLLEHRKMIGIVLDIIIDDIGIKFVVGLWKEIEDMSLSIGFYKVKIYKKNQNTIIEDFDIREVSVVKKPAQYVNRLIKK